jgi:hypothetical protein
MPSLKAMCRRMSFAEMIADGIEAGCRTLAHMRVPLFPFLRVVARKQECPTTEHAEDRSNKPDEAFDGERGFLESDPVVSVLNPGKEAGRDLVIFDALNRVSLVVVRHCSRVDCHAVLFGRD